MQDERTQDTMEDTAAQTVPPAETPAENAQDCAAEFETLIQGRCRQPFQARVQRILDGRLRSLRQENEALRQQAEAQYRLELDCVARLAGEAEAIRQVYGSFDWQREMRDPVFGRLIAAGVDGRTAYEAVHHQELLTEAMRCGARRAGEQLSRAIASGGRRVSENGGGSTAVTRADPRTLTSGELSEIRKRVQRGEKIRF